MKFSTPIEELSYVGPKTEARLKKMGIETLRDLLFYFPRTHEDYSKIVPIKEVRESEKTCIKARILTIKTRRTPKKKMFLTETIIEDETGALSVIWFNQPYVTRQLKKDSVAHFVGSVQAKKGKLILSNPSYELIYQGDSGSGVKKASIHSGRIVPIYREKNKISSKYLRLLIWLNLRHLDQIKDYLSQDILQRNSFLSLKEALRQIHFPKSFTLLDKAKKRLSFDELFLIRLYLQREKVLRERSRRAYAVPFQEDLVKDFVKKLSFELTSDQKKAAWQIIKDLEKNYPMQRLLEGDVGSGKTIVAAIAGLSVIHAGYQVAIMAPTEVLARQHFKQLTKDLSHVENFKIALLLGAESRIVQGKTRKRSVKVKKEKLINDLASGKINMVIGTHALIQKNVKFKNLAFVVVDEQHRFGVEQRANLLNIDSGIEKDSGEKKKSSGNKKLQPHLLSMSATPIPRTLSLVFYGDLSISQLRQVPKGRKKITTQIVLPKDRNDIYSFVHKEIKKGRQAFVICPLIEESDTLETRAVEKEFERLSKEIFPDLKIDLLHGRKKSSEKKETMEKFAKKKIDILVSTSVVEVGIDVPNATIMLIEGAERFGLAQLHQLRGRVGRSHYQSHCFLFTDMPSQMVISRLRALITLNDGFSLAEKDLKTRGPGDFIGRRQSGVPDLIMASLSNLELINLAKKEANAILKDDPNLKKHPVIKKKIDQIKKRAHLE